jgi:hypothetical protein
VKVKVRCQIHPKRVIGVVDMSRGWPSFQSRAGYRGRIARHLGGDSTFVNLKLTTSITRSTPGAVTAACAER